MNGNEMMIVNRNDIAGIDLIAELKNPESTFFCSIKDDGTRSSKVRIYNALNSKGENLTDHLKERINLVDVACHPVRLVDTKTGEISTCLRAVLIADDGTIYQCVSQGVVSSLQKIFAIIGFPTWDEPVGVVPVETKTNSGYKVLTLELVE